MHPKVTIFAITGPIVIGAGNIIEEGAIIINRFAQLINLLLNIFLSSRILKCRKKETMRIGDENLLEVGCRESLFENPPSHSVLEY